MTSLMVAVYHGSTEVVDALLRARADVNISDMVSLFGVIALVDA